MADDDENIYNSNTTGSECSNSDSFLLSLVPPPKRNKEASSDVFCPHCERYVSNKTFRKHRALFCNLADGTWRKDECTEASVTGLPVFSVLVSIEA